jgi:hypothetical protein
VTSIAPSNRPVAGSWIGAAAHVHRCTGRLKCSVAKICNGWSTASAVPGALVPACASSQRAPGTKFIDSAPRRIDAWPSTHSSRPCASHTAIRWSPSSARPPSRSRKIGRTRASGWAARYASRSPSLSSIGAVLSGVIVPAERRHDSATTDRTGAAAEPVSSRSPVTNRSWARPT